MKTYTITVPEGWGLRALLWILFLALAAFGAPVWYAAAKRYIAVEEARTAVDVKVIAASAKECQ